MQLSEYHRRQRTLLILDGGRLRRVTDRTLWDDLEAAWRAWAVTVADLSVQDWARPTRLPGWTVADLVAHHAPFPGLLHGFAQAVPTQGPPTHADAAELIAAFNRPRGIAHTMAEQIADWAVQLAAQADRAQLIAPFARMAPTAVAAARRTDCHQLVDYVGVAVVPFGEAARIFLVEAVVHYLDLADALALPRAREQVGSGALRRVAGLLAAVADPVEFIETATGRRGLPVLPVLR
ncbi:MAG: maleylpyruvate isomerase N-terminal domain-containing protein [Pseudonocardiaceae bacterium]